MNIPAELARKTVAFSLNFKSKKTIYKTVLLCITILLISLPFVSINVSFQSRGQIISEIANNQITSSVQSKITRCLLEENKFFAFSDTLIELETTQIEKEIELQTTKLKELKTIIGDLQSIIQNPNNGILQSNLYRTIQREYTDRLHKEKTKENYYRREINTLSGLFEKGSVAKKEMEETELSLNNTIGEIQNIKTSQISQWENQLRDYIKEKQLIEGEIKRLENERKQYTILASRSGKIKNYTGITTGNYAIPNQTIAEISSDDKLIIECFVSPKDIGYVTKGMRTNLQIDAYNYNQWGILQSKVTDIFTNVVLINDQPFFRVRCSLMKKNIHLKNGYSASLKKDMTLTGRFMITKRTLWQLLFDKMDNWLNPKILDTSLPYK